MNLDHHLARMSRPRKPAGHTEVDNATFDRLVWPDCEVDMKPGDPWLTTRVGSTKFCTFREVSGVES